MIDVLIGLGSNLGDRLQNFSEALDLIDALPETSVAVVSHAYESEPWGVTDQPAFANAVALLHTNLYADQLLDLLEDVEKDLGREAGERNGPRPIDLDILLFGDEEWDSEVLTIPHPRMAARDFVIRPLLEVSPAAVYPDGSQITDAGVTVGRVTRDLGVIPGFEGFQPAPEIDDSAEGPGSYSDIPRELLTGQGPPEGSAEYGRPDVRVDGWEAIGEGVTEVGGVAAASLDLLFAEAVLQDAGIPCVFYPHRPNEGSIFMNVTRDTVRLFVQAAHREEAERLVAQAAAAPCEQPDE